MGVRPRVARQADVPIKGGITLRSNALARRGLIQLGSQRDCGLLGSTSRVRDHDVEGTVLPQHIVVQNRERGGPASAIDNPIIGVRCVERMARRAGDARRERRQELRRVYGSRNPSGLGSRQGHAAEVGAYQFLWVVRVVGLIWS